MNNKKTIIASQANIGLLLDRFAKFFNRNQNGIEVKQKWGLPKKRGETWKDYPLNKTLSVMPKVGKHPFFGKSNELISVQPQSETDIAHIHYSGSINQFERDYPDYPGPEKIPFHSFIIEEGDKIFFKNEMILVIPKRVDIHSKKICSHAFCPLLH